MCVPGHFTLQLINILWTSVCSPLLDPEFKTFQWRRGKTVFHHINHAIVKHSWCFAQVWPWGPQRRRQPGTQDPPSSNSGRPWYLSSHPLWSDLCEHCVLCSAHSSTSMMVNLAKPHILPLYCTEVITRNHSNNNASCCFFSSTKLQMMTVPSINEMILGLSWEFDGGD